MTSDRSKDIQRISEAASDRSSHDRARYLDDACGGDEDLRREVESLLAHHGDAPSSFLPDSRDGAGAAGGGAPPGPEDETVSAGDFGDADGSDDKNKQRGPDPNIGKRIGRYRITDRIASGGMGTVYLAIQESPRRTVALKLMKRGVTSRSALRRFEFEAQLLARLRHPGIAQVYEAGTHDDGEGGVPYFAMEYVPRALTLTEYADQKKLGSRERLDLFTKACDAIGYGHQKGVIHRDLKPDNILVDGFGQPKIIDFGVARATDSDLAVTTLQTNLRQLIGTLQYMSPEQCRGDALDLDARSDVYALGVVLYELLCGQLPYDLSRSAMPAAIDTICTQEPQRPSALDRTLRGDTETIALKALEKEPERRYRNADDLADDVRRHLADEPIEARPPGVLDVMKRFVRRHTAAAMGIAGVFAVLVAVAVVFLSLWGTTRVALSGAEESRVEAEQANQRAAQALRDLWTSVSRSEPARWGDAASADRAASAHDEAAVAASSFEGGRFGESAESFIAALGTWQEAVDRHENFVPELIARGVEAARAGRVDQARAAYDQATSMGVDGQALGEPGTFTALSRAESGGRPGFPTRR